eukprot:Gb_38823 [translate_table: standard]
MLHSSNRRFSSDIATLVNACNPLSDKDSHLWRDTCFTLGQPSPIASKARSVIPRQEVTEKTFSFCMPKAFPIEQKPFCVTF